LIGYLRSQTDFYRERKPDWTDDLSLININIYIGEEILKGYL